MTRKILFILGGLIALCVAGRFLFGVLETSKKEIEAPPSARIFDIPQEQKNVVEEGVVEASPSLLPEQTPRLILLENVPFTSQAPFAQWQDAVFQNGCEEASLVMAAHFVFGKTLTKEEATKEIVALSRFEEKIFGHSIDTSLRDTQRLFDEYYTMGVSEVAYDISKQEIRDALAQKALVLVPADGRKLKNPNFRQPGPSTHMLVIIGYDEKTREFITNDPGTRNGAGYRYPEDVLYDAIRDYPTGDHIPIKETVKAMLIIKKGERQ